MLRFLLQNIRLLFFGFLLAFFSCFGQTVIVSLYVPELMNAFQLSNTAISSLYAIATLASAFLLPWVGRYIDTWPLARFTTLSILALTAALFFLSFATGIWMILIGFWGIRFGGQGLMSHTAASAMVRGFSVNRGKAISLAALGYPASEAVMPLTVAFLIGTISWRGSLQVSALCLLLLIFPLCLWLIRTAPESLRHPNKVPKKDKENLTLQNPLQLLRGRAFWILSPNLFLHSFIVTAVFFYQIQLGESRGWSASWVAGSVSAYAIASAIGMLFSGPVVDRLTARMLFPFYLLCYVIGLVLLSFFQAPVIYPITLFLFGFSSGFGNTIKDAVFAEIYSPNVIGSVRSLFATVMVFSSALGPISFGFLIDKGWPYEPLFLLSAAFIVVALIWSLRIFSRFTKGRWGVLIRRRS